MVFFFVSNRRTRGQFSVQLMKMRRNVHIFTVDFNRGGSQRHQCVAFQLTKKKRKAEQKKRKQLWQKVMAD